MNPEQTPHILAIDAGTSTLKAVLYNAKGRALALAARRYSYHAPHPGWAEADPADWWDALVQAVLDLSERGFDLKRVEAIGLTGQMHTPVLLGEDGQVLPPTILWFDQRASDETKELQTRLKLPPPQLNTSFTLPKLLWLRRHQPQVLDRTRTLLWPKDYLRFLLTGRRLTDVTDAAGAALLDWERCDWAVERLSLVGLPPEALPPLLPAQADAGPLLPEIASRLGLPTSARVIVGAGDVISLLGVAPIRSGRLACSLGSSGMVAMPLSPDQPVHDPDWRLHLYPFLPIPLLNGILSTSGAALTWAWRALYEKQTPFEAAIEAALHTAPGAQGLILLPFLAGERSPYWNDALRATFYGLTLSHSRSHMMRAVMEGVALSLRQLLTIAEELAVPVEEIALAGGGAHVQGWPQICADACQRPVFTYAGEDTGTRPLYAFCRLALQDNLSFAEALATVFAQPQAQYAPNPQLRETYDAAYHRYHQLASFAARSLS